jgi:hypothetical protein
MNNRNLLKEAIADAKAVKETAIANAKAALEEAFTPYLKEKLAAKLAEMDDMEENELEEAEKNEKGMKEDFDMDESEQTDEAYEMDETKHDMEEAKGIEEMDLDELLRELDEMEEGKKEEMTEGEDDLINDPKGPTAHGNVAEEEEMEMGDDDEEMDLENMTEEDLKSFIESVIADMVADGELEGNIEGEESEEDEVETSEDEEEVNIDELVAELKERKKYGGNKGDVPAAKRGDKKDTAEEEGIEDYKKKLKEIETKLEESYTALKTVKSDLNEVNLLNAKLLYTNKIFRAKNLNESQKVKILESFDKATTVKEAKLVYETLSGGIIKTKTPINESIIGGASKAMGIAPNKTPILEVNDQFNRWQILAGIKKN